LGGVLIPFSWYVYFYLGVLLTLPVVRYLFPKGRLLGVLLAYIPLTALAFVWGWLDKTDQFTLYRELVVYYVCVLGGFSFAKYGLFEAVRSGLNKVKLDHWWFYIPLSLLSMAAVSLVRNVLLFPFAILPILFACVCLFERPLPSWVLFPLSWLGKLSMPIWFIHYVFFADYINGFIPLYSVVMSPRIGIIILTFALVICIPIALIYYAFFAWIGRFVYKKNKKSV